MKGSVPSGRGRAASSALWVPLAAGVSALACGGLSIAAAIRPQFFPPVPAWLLALLFLLAAGGATYALVRRERAVLRDLASHGPELEELKPLPVPRGNPEAATLAQSINRVIERFEKGRDELERQIREQVRTELSAEKARMEAFLRGIGDGISIVDREFKIIWMNDSLKKIFGDQVGQFCYRVYERKETVCGGCPVMQAFRTGMVHQSLRRVYGEGGRLRYFESTGSPIKDESGEIIAGIELARDVTQRIKLERSVSLRSRELAKANEDLQRTNERLKAAYQELKETQAQLIQSEKLASLGTLAAGIAHEINNPINFVYGSMRLMEDNIGALLKLVETVERLPRSPEQEAVIEKVKQDLDYDFVLEDIRKIVKNVTTGAERVKEIVDNLRTFSRVDATAKSPVDVHEGIDSTLSLLYHEFKNRVEIIKEYGELPSLLGHQGKLNQVFMNILHNAIQAIPDKGTIRIRTSVQNGHAVLEFTDSGVGIPKHIMKNIFDPFFTTKEVGKGTGLGLSISYSIIKDHGGRIDVDSEVGRGTTFTIRLPIEPPRVAEAAKPKE